MRKAASRPARPFRIAAILSASLFAFLASCASAPKAAPHPPSIAFLPSTFPSADPSRGAARGALFSAVQMPADSADGVASSLNPAMLSTRMNIAPMEAAGFFDALAAARKTLKTVRNVRIHYWSEDATGRSVKLSGLLLLPEAASGRSLQVPLLLLCHGTQLLRERVPSRLAGSERPIALLAAASGWAVALPDYPGMGDGEGFHTYCHADSLAHSGVDLLRAVREWIGSRSEGAYRESGELRVAGYSEGGYAAMAVIRELELEAKGEFPLAAGYALAGPFDMSGTMRERMISDEPTASPSFLIYAIMGWLGVYGSDLDPRRVFVPEIVEKVLPLMDGRSSSSAVNAKIAQVLGFPKGKVPPSAMTTEAFRSGLAKPESSPAGARMLAILRENDLYDWPADPSIPLRLMAARSDEQVPFANNRLAFDALIARGAQATLVELSQTGHAAGAYEAFGYLLMDLWKRD